jgi:DNA-binding transcriptional MerR regulator
MPPLTRPPGNGPRQGYRLYDDDDLLRLQQILIGRALGMPLEQIKRSMTQASIEGRHSNVNARSGVGANGCRPPSWFEAEIGRR